ncbi:uncharacterized protein LOC112554331 [Pomacea canaliculata]|uniref:uncharacterized protein LOC112554331 n=1 Tax=Pomacea canaliculata TaxID=400727 RepID=UPI000D7260D8|nr:uncharacterized protein LOC112554331 [Pomacea canaliculata]
MFLFHAITWKGSSHLSSEKLSRKFVYIGFIPLAFVVGAIANVLNCLVFCRQGLSDRINLCLFSLALSDLVYLTALMVRNLEKLLALVVGKWIASLWLEKLIQFRLLAMYSGFVLVSNFLASLISVERCLCVVSPLKARAYLPMRLMLTFIIIGSVLILTGTQFLAFMYDVTCTVYIGPDRNQSDIMIIASDVYRDNRLLMDVLDTFVFASIVPNTSVIITAVTTVITAVKLKAVVRQRKQLACSQTFSLKEVAVTRMLIVISGIYIACVSPRVMYSVVQFIVAEFRVWGSLCNLAIVCDAVSNASLALHSAANFFVYFTMGTRFRLTLRRTVHSA